MIRSLARIGQAAAEHDVELVGAERLGLSSKQGGDLRPVVGQEILGRWLALDLGRAENQVVLRQILRPYLDERRLEPRAHFAAKAQGGPLEPVVPDELLTHLAQL